MLTRSLFRAAPVRVLALVWLAAAVSGCMSPSPSNQAPPEPDYDLTEEDSRVSEALAHFAMGLLYEGEQDPSYRERAIDEYSKAIDLDPERHRLYTRSALTALSQQLPDRAVETLRALCRERPDSVQAWVDLAMVSQVAGMVDLALESYGKAISLEPERAALYLPMAKMLFRNRRDDEALELLRSGLHKVDQADALVAFSYTQSKEFLDQREMERAIACLELVAQHAPSNRQQFQHLLGELYENIGFQQKAIEHYKLATEEKDPLPQSFIKLSSMHADRSPDDVLAALERGLERLPGNPLLLHRLAEVYISRSNETEALENLKQATQAADAIPDSFVKLALLQLKRDVGAALDTLRAGDARFPDNLMILSSLGFIYSNENRVDEAIRVYDRIAETAGDKGADALTPRFYMIYGSLCERTGQFAKAESIFESCIRRHPDTHEALNYLAYMWAERGVKLDRALEYVVRALELDPNNGAYIDTLGWIYYKLKRYDEALIHIRRADMVLGGDPVVVEHLGDVLEAMGKRDEAVAQWQRSLTLDPESESVRNKLAAAGAEADAAAGKEQPTAEEQPAAAEEQPAAAEEQPAGSEQDRAADAPPPEAPAEGAEQPADPRPEDK